MNATRTAAPQRLLSRARTLTAAEAAGIAWLGALQHEERERALSDLKVVQVSAGELLCRVGRPATYWFGVIDGLLKLSNDTEMGIPITFTGIPPGGWFGEGTVIKREAYRYNIQALRKSVVAGLSVEAFHWLVERSIPFNRFITQQLNERLGQFISAREIDRMTDADGRVGAPGSCV
jgi:CRP-like cAMP-binding protein